MKTAKMTIDGIDYLLCFSVRAIKECTERYGDVENIGAVIDNSSPTEALDEAAWLLTTMMKAGERYAKIRDIKTHTFFMTFQKADSIRLYATSPIN